MWPVQSLLHVDSELVLLSVRGRVRNVSQVLKPLICAYLPFFSPHYHAERLIDRFFPFPTSTRLVSVNAPRKYEFRSFGTSLPLSSVLSVPPAPSLSRRLVDDFVSVKRHDDTKGGFR